MAKGKRQGLFTGAGVIHFTLYTLAVLITVWLSGAPVDTLAKYLWVGIFIFVSHWLVDTTQIVEWWMKIYQQSQLLMMRIMVDQIFHLITLAVVAIAVSYI